MDQQTAVAALESVITGRGSSWMVPEDMNPAMGMWMGRDPGLSATAGCCSDQAGITGRPAREKRPP